MLFALLVAGSIQEVAAGVPVHVPISPDTVLLRVPASAARTGDTVGSVAAWMELGIRTGEERYFGLAERIVDQAPVDQRPSLRLTKAQLLQHRHAFEESLRVLDELIADEPRAADARLMRAQILVQLMRSQAARQDCIAIQPHVSLLVSATCTAQVRAGLGDLRGAYALIQAALRNAPASEGAGRVRSWSAGVAGELAQRLGDETTAGGWYEEAWHADGDSHFARLNYADWLLAQQRHEIAAQVVAGWQSPADRLRQVLAQRGGESEVRLRLAWDEASARAENGHLLDMARFTWLLTSDRRSALVMARKAFAQRQDADSARWLFRMAGELKDSAALKEVEQWRRLAGYVDVRLQTPAGMPR